jgi:hypothetical protein
MPLCRLRQAVEAIAQRLMSQVRLKAGMVEWHAKHVASVSAVSEEAGKAIRDWRLMEPEATAEPVSDEDLEKIIFGEAENAGAADPRNDAGLEWLASTLSPMRPPPPEAATP